MRYVQSLVPLIVTLAIFAMRFTSSVGGPEPATGDHRHSSGRTQQELPELSTLPMLAPLGGRGRRGTRGAIYARFSTRFQHSIEDQVRICLAWAKANGIEIDESCIFIDRAVTGKTHRREGLQKMMEAIAGDKVDVVVTFATNRLFRKMYRSLQFIDEEIVSRRKRCVFVAQNIDTEKSEFWRQLIVVFGMLDELQLQAQAGFVRAAHEGLLHREMVHGTISFGYFGEIVPGDEKTKRGRPRRRWVISEEQAKWVRQVFHWFTVDGLSISAIKRLLRAQNAPLPPKSPSGKWTYLAVRLLLANRRYIGDFSYAWNDAVWQAKQGYNRQFKRQTPRAEKWIERLRIIDLATFNSAQERLANYKGRGGRRRKSASDDLPPDILKGLLFCEKHNCVLTANSYFMQCRHCKDEGDEGSLYSQVNREIALELICSKISELINADAAFVLMVKQSIGEEVAKLQAPDPGAIKALDAEYAALSQKIEFLMDAPAETKQDQKEQHARLADLQRKRGLVYARREELQKAIAAPMQIPTNELVEQQIQRIGEVMNAAGRGSKDAALMSDARQIVHMVTGGRIVMTQAGERQAKLGWLEGSFQPQLVAPFFAAAGDQTQATACAASDATVTIEFREPPEIEALSEQVMTMVNQGLMMAEIALKLGLHRSRISLAIRHWHESRGLPVPDGRNRRATLSKKHLVQPLYQAIADEAMRLVNEGLKLGEVAQRLNVDRNTITQSVRWWHEQHGIPLPPAQGRRKTPPKDDAPPGGEGLDAA